MSNYLIPIGLVVISSAFLYTYVVSKQNKNIFKKSSIFDKLTLIKAAAKTAYRTTLGYKKNTAVIDNGIMKISYHYDYKDYTISVPFDHIQSLCMIGYKAELLKNGEIIDITQQPGIPYMCDSEMYDGSYIKIINEANDEYEIYNKAPLYATKLMLDE